MERLTKRNEKGQVVLNFNCQEGCEYLTCNMEEGYQCQHQCEADIVGKLADYEDAEEQGLLRRLYCKKEDIVYDVVLCDDGKYHMFEMMVCAINPFGDVRKGKVWNVYLECVDDCSKAYRSFYDFGKTVFTVKEEAEQALKKMESE